ncbi:hypothetical protein KJ966_24605 [bacterium]|nr:hypothetical protein [bacterium]
MKRIFLFIIFVIIGAWLAFAGDGTTPDLGATADAGFTFLELLLMAIGTPTCVGLAWWVRFAKKGTKMVLNSLDSNPFVDNKKLLLHAAREKDKTAARLFKKLN